MANPGLKKSAAAWAAAKHILPGGVDSPVRAFKDVGGIPRFMSRGKGPFIYDVDGNRYLDFCQSWGALILGHADPAVVRAATTAIKAGSSFGAPTEAETALATTIRQAIPSMERLRFVSSGTEAVMSAVRLARGYTGKTKIVKFDGGYHGHADHLLIAAGSGLAGWRKSTSAGVPQAFARETISIPFNDQAAVEQVFKKYPQEIAAVLAEPVPANMGVVLPQPGFLPFLREITKKHKSLLIFDEVITGFRLTYGGAQKIFRVRPDLTCLGKIIGAGFPVGAYGGAKAIMALLAPEGPVYQAGTLSGNPVAMAAGLAALRRLRDMHAHESLNKRGNQFSHRLRRGLKGQGIEVNQIGSMFTLFFSREPVRNFFQAKQSDARAFAGFYHRALEHGIYLSPSPFEANFISLAHSEQDLEKAAQVIVKALST
jgi:glutamate-1-semialdehyde 2,1-aminomutase